MLKKTSSVAFAAIRAAKPDPMVATRLPSLLYSLWVQCPEACFGLVVAGLGEAGSGIPEIRHYPTGVSDAGYKSCLDQNPQSLLRGSLLESHAQRIRGSIRDQPDGMRAIAIAIAQGKQVGQWSPMGPIDPDVRFSRCSESVATVSAIRVPVHPVILTGYPAFRATKRQSSSTPTQPTP